MKIQTKQKQIETVLREWSAQSTSKNVKLTDRLQQMQELVKLGAVRSYEPILPLCLNLNGKPYSLKNYYPFTPLFRLAQPTAWVLKTGRQLSKSQSMATSSVMSSASMPFYKTLHVKPLYEQIRRFSSNYVRPLIDGSPVKSLWISTTSEKSVLQRSFKNGSIMFFSFASGNADRIRGVSCSRVLNDEVQDSDADIFPVILETMSASTEYIPTVGYAGTPKTLDNPLEGYWRSSSQAEWITQCRKCKKYNIPTLEFDLERMVGPYSNDISEQYPGVQCAKCKAHLFPRDGRWVHKFPDKRWTMAGYHIPQIILPLHYANPDKWSLLLAKQQGAGNMTRARFMNEVMGESIDAGQKLVTETELRAAACLPWKNTKRPTQQMITASDEYHMKVLAVDWGGGGETGTSFTAIAVLGYLPSGEIHVIWGKRMVQSQSHVQEALEIKHYFEMFNCNYIAHDYTGAGTIRETVLVQMGVPEQYILSVEYVGSAAGQIIKFVPASPVHGRNRYRLDKTRSLLNLCNAIRFKIVKFFEYDYYGTDHTGLICDFLALIESKIDSRSGSDIYIIQRNPMLTDDFAQAVNIGAASIWHSNKAWPDFSAAIEYARITEQQELEMNGGDQSWETDPSTYGT